MVWMDVYGSNNVGAKIEGDYALTLKECEYIITSMIRKYNMSYNQALAFRTYLLNSIDNTIESCYHVNMKQPKKLHWWDKIFKRRK